MQKLFRIKNSLALRLLKVVFSIYLCLTIVVTIIQMSHEYFLEKNFIKNSLIISQSIFQNNLTASIWNFDNEQLFITVDAILKEPSISGIQIFDEYNNIMVQKGYIINNQSQSVLLQNNRETFLPSYVTLFQHPFNLIRENKKIGSVILYSNNRLIFDKVKYNFFFIIANAIIKTIALWLLFVWAFNKFLTKQLDVFCQAMEKVDIDNQKDYKLNLETFESYELSRIEYFFNELLQRIIDSRDKLTELNKTLEQKVIERTKEIENKNQKLELLNQEKSNFISIAVHDLKTPLGNITNLSFLIEKAINSGKSFEKILHYNNLINTSSQNMLEIIKNFLDAGKIESGAIKINLTPVNIILLLNSIITENSQHAESKNITINFQPDNKNYTIISDEFILSQIVANIISNAIKYSPLNGVVTINVFKKEMLLQIEIADQGKGFSLEDKEKLFTKFCRLNNKPTANESSTGLGLFIVKKLSDLLNLTIDCESIEAYGSTFRINIPDNKA